MINSLIGQSGGEAVVFGWGNMAPVVRNNLLLRNTFINIYDPASNPTSEIPNDARRLERPDDVPDADVYVMAVPYPYPNELMNTLEKRVDPEAAILDMSSVQTVAVKAYRERGIDAEHRRGLLLTHPLFGPKSVRRHKDMANRGIVLITEGEGEPERSDYAKRLVTHWERNGASVITSTAEQHDREMAAHSLALFIGPILKELVVSEQLDPRFQTPSIRAMASFINSTDGNSPELSRLIQTHNPYAAEARTQFLKELIMSHAGIQLDISSSDPENRIEHLRGIVGDLTEIIVASSFARSRATDQIGRSKAELGEPMRTRDRERQVLTEAASTLHGLGADTDFVNLVSAYIRTLMRDAVDRNENAANKLMRIGDDPYDQEAASAAIAAQA